MGNPLYRVRASGMGGSGYARPPLPGEDFKLIKNADGDLIEAVTGPDLKPMIVPGVTTVTKQANADGLIQWSVDQVAAYAVANVESLLNRTMEQGWGFLRFYHKRTPDLTDPLRTAHSGVLNDLAELGTRMHDYVETDLLGNDFPPVIDSREMQEMVGAWESFKFQHKIEVVYTEVTLWGLGYAGTFDLLAYIDGILYLIDLKTSRRVGSSHLMQLAALRAAPLMYARNPEGKWELVDFPQPERYALLQVRPNDLDNSGLFIPAFMKLHEVSEGELDIHYKKFRACLALAQCDQELKNYQEPATLAVEKQEVSEAND